jgi:hypothetical protein
MAIDKMQKSSKIRAQLSFLQAKELEVQNKKLQEFIRILEGKFGDVIWYIGMDLLSNDIYERFIFNKGGFMEISMKTLILEACFNTPGKAEKFNLALKKSVEKFKKSKFVNIKKI